MAHQTRVSRWRAVAACVALAAVTSGCDALFEVDNPNDLVQEDLETPAASTALVNGAEATVARGLADLVLAVTIPTDELVWVGSYDAGRELDVGFLSNPANEFGNSESWGTFNEGRFMADEAVRLMEGWDAEKTLRDRSHLARSYLYSAISYVAAADHYDNFVISNRKDAAPPVGEANMVKLYDTAIDRLTKGIAIAQAVKNTNLEAAMLGMRARAHFGKAVWMKLNPAGRVPADPLVNSAEAAADARAALALVTGDWKYQFTYGPTTVGNQMGAWVNSRQEFRVDSRFGVPTPSGTKVRDVALQDPIDKVADETLRKAMTDQGLFAAVTQLYPPFTVVSARELHLIVAEVALAQGNQAAAAAAINAVRALDKKTPFSGQVALRDLLIHERSVNLFMQGRRLADMYRFGIKDPRWQPQSDAASKPGTFFPIPQDEIESNQCVSGGC